MFIFNDKNKLYFLANFTISLFIIPFFYLIFFNHSLLAFCKYIYGSLEVSSGFQIAMSTEYNDAKLFWITTTALFYLLLIVTSFKYCKKTFTLLCSFTGPLFLLYKHGFVRSDGGHNDIAFSGLLSIAFLLIIFTDWKKLSKNKNIYVAFIFLFSLFVAPSFVYKSDTCIHFFSHLKSRIFDFPERFLSIKHQNPNNIEKLPDEILKEIGKETVSIYPWEVFYVASNDLNYKQTPCFQIYATYTPWLDKKTAEFYSNNNAPTYIILDASTIDYRWPFIEVPQTWFAIKNNYKVIIFKNGLFLLKKVLPDTNLKTVEKTKLMQTCSFSKNKQVLIPENAGIMKLSAQLSIVGRIVKFLWKIPKVDMTVTYKDGRIETHRILLNMFSAGVDLSCITNASADNIIDYLNYDGNLSRVKSLSFSGPGLRFYKDFFLCEIYEKKECINNYPVKNYKLYADAVSLPNYKISEKNFMYNIDTQKISNKIINLVGWAFCENDDCHIYIENDGKFYMAKKVSRPDIKTFFSIEPEMIGFDIKIQTKTDDCILYLVNDTKKEIYKKAVDKVLYDGKTEFVDGQTVSLDLTNLQSVASEFLLETPSEITELNFRAYTWKNDYEKANLIMTVYKKDNHMPIYSEILPLSIVKNNSITTFEPTDWKLDKGEYSIELKADQKLNNNFAIAANFSDEKSLLYDMQKIENHSLCLKIFGKTIKRNK